MKIDCGNPRSFDADSKCFIEYVDMVRLLVIDGFIRDLCHISSQIRRKSFLLHVILFLFFLASRCVLHRAR